MIATLTELAEYARMGVSAVGSAIVVTVAREAAQTGPPSFRPLHFIAAVTGGIRVVLSIWRGR